MTSPALDARVHPVGTQGLFTWRSDGHPRPHHTLCASSMPENAWCVGLLSVEVRGFEPLAPTLRTYPTSCWSPWCVSVLWLSASCPSALPLPHLHDGFIVSVVGVQMSMAKRWPREHSTIRCPDGA